MKLVYSKPNIIINDIVLDDCLLVSAGGIEIKDVMPDFGGITNPDDIF